MNPKPVVLDVDAGVDDALAILLALSSPELEVLAVNTVSGNITVDLATKNVLRTLSWMPLGSGLTVAKGSDKPLSKDLFMAKAVHGDDGLGDLGDQYYPALDWTLVSEQSAAKTLVDLVANAPGSMTIVATGPVTNIAIAIQAEPKVMGKVKEIVIMGGAVDSIGNIPPLYAAEFNTYVDPDALDIVLRSHIPVTLIPTGVTHKVCLMRDIAREVLSNSDSAVARFAFDACQVYMDFILANDGIDGAYMHDPLAVASVIDPSLISTVPYRVYVEAREGMSRGMIVPYRHPSGLVEDPNCRVAVEVSSERFITMLLKRLSGIAGSV